MITVHVVTENTELSNSVLRKIKRLSEALKASLKWYVLCHNSVGDRRYIDTTTQLKALWQSYTRQEIDKCQVLNTQLSEHFSKVDISSIFDKHWGNTLDKQSSADDLVIIIRNANNPEISSASKLFISRSNMKILIVGEKPWHNPCRISGAIDPFHEDDPDLLADKAVYKQVKRLSEALVGSYWRLIHAIYIPPLAVNHKREISAIHHEEVSSFCRKIRCPQENIQYLSGRPENAIEEHIKQDLIDILVVGSRKHGFFEKYMSGSTVEVLLSETAVDILIARTKMMAE